MAQRQSPFNHLAGVSRAAVAGLRWPLSKELRCGKSDMGQTATSRDVPVTAVLPLKADVQRGGRRGSFGPQPDSCAATKFGELNGSMIHAKKEGQTNFEMFDDASRRIYNALVVVSKTTSFAPRAPMIERRPCEAARAVSRLQVMHFEP